jgi:hypothetical protein
VVLGSKPILLLFNCPTLSSSNHTCCYNLLCCVACADHKKVVLGTKPILLSAFSSGGQRHIFAASDRPTIIYSNNKKLLYSNLNENEVGGTHCTTFSGLEL